MGGKSLADVQRFLKTAVAADDVRVVSWQAGHEADLQTVFRDVDILVINHGINVHGDRTAAAIAKSLEINSLSNINKTAVRF